MRRRESFVRLAAVFTVGLAVAGGASADHPKTNPCTGTVLGVADGTVTMLCGEDKWGFNSAHAEVWINGKQSTLGELAKKGAVQATVTWTQEKAGGKPRLAASKFVYPPAK